MGEQQEQPQVFDIDKKDEETEIYHRFIDDFFVKVKAIEDTYRKASDINELVELKDDLNKLREIRTNEDFGVFMKRLKRNDQRGYGKLQEDVNSYDRIIDNLEELDEVFEDYVGLRGKADKLKGEVDKVFETVDLDQEDEIGPMNLVGYAEQAREKLPNWEKEYSSMEGNLEKVEHGFSILADRFKDSGIENYLAMVENLIKDLREILEELKSMIEKIEENCRKIDVKSKELISSLISCENTVNSMLEDLSSKLDIDRQDVEKIDQEYKKLLETFKGLRNDFGIYFSQDSYKEYFDQIKVLENKLAELKEKIDDLPGRIEAKRKMMKREERAEGDLERKRQEELAKMDGEIKDLDKTAKVIKSEREKREAKAELTEPEVVFPDEGPVDNDFEIEIDVEGLQKEINGIKRDLNSVLSVYKEAQRIGREEVEEGLEKAAGKKDYGLEKFFNKYRLLNIGTERGVVYQERIIDRIFEIADNIENMINRINKIDNIDDEDSKLTELTLFLREYKINTDNTIKGLLFEVDQP
jgi:chromosome segregation ATPase